MNKSLLSKIKFNIKKNFAKDVSKTIIIRTDGGICSQISFCAYGMWLEKQGYNVKYDLSWFRESGKDFNNNFVRNYDMDKAFPDLHFEIATEEEVNYYKKYNTYTFTSPKDNKSGYILGYPKERAGKIYLYKDIFYKSFNPVDKNEVSDLADEINTNNVCAVHVRRGDLSKYTVAYGHPTPSSYFIKAINIINKLNPKTIFYFFSEEFDWIKEEIIPKLGEDIKYKICDKNGADKGYLDLYLMSKCDYIIASIGSLAVYAKILSEKNPLLIIDKLNIDILENLDNVILLNDTILLNAQTKKKEEINK